VHCTGEVRGLSIHAPIQAPTNLSADPARLHLSHCGRCTESPEEINKHIAALPYEQPLATPLAAMSAKLISLSEPSKIGRLCRRDIDLKMHAPRSEGERAPCKDATAKKGESTVLRRARAY
jgi:hypothetical protein